MKAHALMANISPDLALVAIRRSVAYESDEKLLAKFLELQGRIESDLGKFDLAIQTFRYARKIIEKHPEYFKSGDAKDLRERIFTAIKEFNNEET